MSLDTNLLNKIESKEIVAPNKRVAKAISDYVAFNKDEAKILKRGWEPYTKPNNWYAGFIEATTLNKFLHPNYFVLIVTLCLLGFGIWSSLHYAVHYHNHVTGPIANMFLSFGISFIFISVCSTWWWVIKLSDEANTPYSIVFSKQRFDIEIGAIKISSDSVVISSYVGLLPRTVYEKYKRDRSLFDAVYITSPDKEDFSEKVYLNVPKFDPALVGRKKDRFYVGAHFDIAKDLKSMASESNEPLIQGENT